MSIVGEAHRSLVVRAAFFSGRITLVRQCRIQLAAIQELPGGLFEAGTVEIVVESGNILRVDCYERWSEEATEDRLKQELLDMLADWNSRSPKFAVDDAVVIMTNNGSGYFPVPELHPQLLYVFDAVRTKLERMEMEASRDYQQLYHLLGARLDGLIIDKWRRNKTELGLERLL